jgi:PHD/YefM family antitoxin component YafN of YafNO toxin-antitoxin module
MDIDDPSSYVTDRLDVLERIDRALELFEGDDKSPFVFGDTEIAQAWLIYSGAYDEMARARAWVRADQAATADPGSTELAAIRDGAAQSALHLDRPGQVLPALELRTPDQFVAEVPRLVDQIRSGRFAPVAVGRRGTPEAVLVSQDEYRELIQSHMRWHQSPPFLASLDPAVHKPMAKSRPVDLDEFFRSLGPASAELWEQRQRRRTEDS